MTAPGDSYPLVSYVCIANHPGDEYLPSLFGQTGAPADTPADLIYAVTNQPNDGSYPPATDTEMVFPMPQWAGDLVDCYVTAVWMPPDKYGSQDPNDYVFTDFPQGEGFTWTGTTGIAFAVDAPATCPAAGGTVTITATMGDFTHASDMYWQMSGGSSGGSTWSLIDATHASVALTDASSAVPGWVAGASVQIVVHSQGNDFVGTPDVTLT